MGFNLEERVAMDGVLKGISQFYMKKPLPLGPGQYALPPVESRVNKKESYKFTIPKAKETQEEVRARRRFGTSPGPGVYDLPSRFDDIDRDSSQVIKKLARRVERGRGCWAATQYGRIFGAMTPKRGDAPKEHSRSAPTLEIAAPAPKE